MNAKTKTTSATTSKNPDNTKTQKITRKKVRLFFYGGARKGSHNNTFLDAATNVRNDYEKDKSKDIEIKPLYEHKSAEDIIERIEMEADNSIESIDFFSHGTPAALRFQRSTFGFGQDLFMNTEEQKKEDKWDGNAGNLSEINYSKFTNTAIIEVHGCRVGSVEKEFNNINWAMIFSKYLYDAGKKKSVVIGHITKANPDQHKTLTGSDYRHGNRRIYHNGEELDVYRKEGRISSEYINKKLSGK
ncbi:hypothetical protein EHE65_03955 [Salmonella enterica subsp. enterica]|nr:hypothetical protein [Salmonella enterica subsp. enterica]